MLCIFCKSDSSASISEEHIVPQSLGNKEHAIPPGIVCDKCNNYFSKLEKKLLEQPYFTSLRFRNRIRSKKNKYPREKGLLLSPLTPIELTRDSDGKLSIDFENGTDPALFQNIKKGTFITPAIDMPEENDRIISRFIGKVGIEYLAMILMEKEEGLNEVVIKPELDLLRNYVRYGTPDRVWPYSLRRIYPEGDLKSDDGGEPYEILHEFRLLYTDSDELYIVVAIMGVEYCLNMGGPDLDGYKQWLEMNQNRSPLEDSLCGHINMGRILSE
ncbi:MAG: HNH endonuclease [Dehalococcoidia bacterium]|jgi:hypothetical protein